MTRHNEHEHQTPQGDNKIESMMHQNKRQRPLIIIAAVVIVTTALLCFAIVGSLSSLFGDIGESSGSDIIYSLRRNLQVVRRRV